MTVPYIGSFDELDEYMGNSEGVSFIFFRRPGDPFITICLIDSCERSPDNPPGIVALTAMGKDGCRALASQIVLESFGFTLSAMTKQEIELHRGNIKGKTQ